MRNVIHGALLALLFTTCSGTAYAQYDLPATTVRLENDTFDSAVKYLGTGDQEGAMNLINRDPLVARFSLVRMLREPSLAELGHAFADLFPASSRSEIEMPFIESYDKLTAERRGEFLNWFETASRAEYVIAHQSLNKFWSQAASRALSDLESARAFFSLAAFPSGEAFCIRIIANEYYFLWDIPSFGRAQALYDQARSIYSNTHNARGEALALEGLAAMYRRTNELPRLRDYLHEALQQTRDPQDPIAETYLLLDFPQHVSLDEKKAAWAVIEPLPGLRALKYSVLRSLANIDKTYTETIDRMLAQETDPILVMRNNSLQLSPTDTDSAGGRGSVRAIEIASSLPYDLSAINSSATPGASIVAWLLGQRGWAEMDLLRYSKAEDSFLAALDEANQFDDRSDLGAFLTNKAWFNYCLAYLYEVTGDYPQARAKAQDALTAAKQVGFGSYIVQDIGVLARIDAELGDLNRAEAELTEASHVYTPVMSEALTDLAEIHLNFGFYAKALKDLDQLDAQFRQRPGQGALNVFLTDELRLMTLSWLRIGDLNRAMEFAKAVESRPSGHTIDEGVIGMVLIEMKRYGEAERYFKDRLTHPEWGNGARADSHKNLGRLYRLQNRRSLAMDQLATALEIYRAMFRRRDELEVLIELGQLALHGSAPHEARPYLEQALHIAEEARWPQGIWSVRAGIAELAKADKDTNGAVEQLKLALNAVETVSARMNSQLTRSTFVEDKVPLYDELIRLVGPSQPKDAFEYSERRREQSILQAAQRQGVISSSPSNNDLIRKKDEAEARLHGKQKALMDQLSRPLAARNVELIEATQRDLQVIQTQHTELLRQLEEDDPVEASRLGLVRVVTAADVQRDILKPGDALVEYLVTDREVFAFLITRQQCRFVRLPVTHAVLTNRIQSLLAPFVQLKSGQVDLLHLKYDVEIAHELYKDLIVPLEPQLQNIRKLIIVPDDVLNYLPFESLARTAALGQAQLGVRYAEYRDVDWLVNHYSIVYAISATSLHPRFHQARPEPRSLLAFGNPKLNMHQLKDAAAGLRGAALETYMPALAPLPKSAEEASVVAELLRSKLRTTVLTGERARVSEFIQQGASASYIHFAVHSLPNEQQPYYSALVLSPDSDSDGLLQTYEIMQTHLTARLVTLSSCETISGKLYKGEGLLGFRRAFLMAGAESVVVSFWSIDDSTADFMAIFYGNIAKGQPIADALRNSKLQYLKKTIAAGTQQMSLSHPFFWAPFALSSTFIQ